MPVRNQSFAPKKPGAKRPAPKPPASDNRRMVVLASAVVVSAVLFTTIPAIDRRLKTSFSERLASHVETLAPGPARVETRRLAARGLEAIPSLVRLAGSTNAAAADAARTAVSSHLAGWESEFRTDGDARLLVSRLDVLAEALDQWILSYDAAGRAWADRVTLKIVRDTDVLSPAASAVLLSRCDRILAAPPAVATVSPAPPVAAPPESAVAALPIARPVPEPLSDQSPRLALAPLRTESPQTEPLAPATTSPPAGDLRLVEDPPPAPLAVPDLRSVAEAETGPNSSESSDGAESADRPAATGDGVTPAPREGPLALRPRPIPPPAADTAVVDVPSPQQARLRLRRYRQMSDRELSQQLAAAGGFDARAIQQVLSERKLPTSAGPTSSPTLGTGEAVQREILEQVSKLSPARGRQLLRSLATDANEDADIRLQALALLATSGDPMLPTIARDRAIEDADPRVAELATRIIRDEKGKK